MGLVGVLYLVFEESVLSPRTNTKQDVPLPDSLSRSILGAQIGLIGLAMLVTKSSVASIQSKQGLPLGNQVVGWAVLRKVTAALDDSYTDRHDQLRL